MNEQQLIKAAESGDVSAMKTLAKFYAQQSCAGNDDKVGDVVTFESVFAEPKRKPKLEAKAYKYFRMAAEAGDAESMTEVGWRIYDGIGTEQDRQSGEHMKWYRRGAEAGDPDAMHVVAFSSQDPAEKFKWYELCAKLLPPSLNKEDSIKQTAINYAAGRGTEKNLERAEEWLAKLDERTAAFAMIEIGQLTKEISWLERAAEFLPDANIQIAEEFVLQNDFARALVYYKRAAEQGSPDAMSIIGDIYYIGENGVDQDYEEAFRWYSRAAELDYNMAAIKRALMIYRGLIAEKDNFVPFIEFAMIATRRERFPMVYRFNNVARYYTAKIWEENFGLTRDTVYKYQAAAGLPGFVPPNESVRKLTHAAYKIGDAYFLGTKDTPQDFDESVNAYKWAIEHGESGLPYKIDAAKKLIHIFELGEGVDPDEEQAAHWREELEKLIPKKD